MPPRIWSIRITDILDAAAKNQKYTQGIPLADFQKDEKTIDAVIRNFSVIGEAAARIPDAIRKKYPNIPWAKMIGMRNFVVHEYFGISTAVLWITIHNDLPKIEPLLTKILQSHAKLKAIALIKKTKKTLKSKK